jgi:hypothetical protein
VRAVPRPGLDLAFRGGPVRAPAGAFTGVPRPVGPAFAPGQTLPGRPAPGAAAQRLAMLIAQAGAR